VGRRLPRRAVETIACGVVGASCGCALIAFLARGPHPYDVVVWRWFAVGSLDVAMDIHYDALAAVMALMVTFVATLVHVYSVHYLRGDSGTVRYFCLLNLFVFAMLVVALADNLIFLYLGWEAVGFCSYALIGFWYRVEQFADAGRKAFVVTRIGDVAMGIALGVAFLVCGRLSVAQLGSQAPHLAPGVATLLGLLFLWAAVGKSAQLPLSLWLPDAMAGPTPVSALIHAATMVTAGVYLLMRLFPVIAVSPAALFAVALVGALSACYGALAALAQNDCKRVLAYSTVSQVGYMFLAVGCSDIAGGMFHLLTHAFFKSLLFLAAGCVMQALDEEHDIFRMGGVLRQLPAVSWAFLAGAAALAGLPLTAGFFSKDRILATAFSQPHFPYTALWLLALLATAVTVLYTFRLFFVVFLGPPAGPAARPLRRLPQGMVHVLWPLAVLSLSAGALNLPGPGWGREWLAHYLEAVTAASVPVTIAVETEFAMALGCGLVALLALLFAYCHYGPPNLWGGRSPLALRPKLRELLSGGFGLDRACHLRIAQPYAQAARFLWQQVDRNVLDALWERSARACGGLSGLLQEWTDGRLSRYLTMFLLGFTLILGGLTVIWMVR
jgi:NADH-quinone oxidoreductase subunit L